MGKGLEKILPRLKAKSAVVFYNRVENFMKHITKRRGWELFNSYSWRSNKNDI